MQEEHHINRIAGRQAMMREAVRQAWREAQS